MVTPVSREVEFTATDGCRLAGLRYTQESADARRCLCLHGLGVDANVWQFVALALWSQGFDVLCLDLRGHGHSDSGKWRQFRPRQMAIDVLEFCQSERFAPEVLIAQSFGNWVGLELMERFPQAFDLQSFLAVTQVWYGHRKAWRKAFPIAKEKYFEENHVSINHIEGNYGIHRGRKLAVKCQHWKDETGMKEGFAQ